ncbi:hypothetical protein PINS_up001287 [Pythium insidiosum]|nr:hypothetical protein PINS_up001287 [Pythium insidiosum]
MFARSLLRQHARAGAAMLSLPVVAGLAAGRCDDRVYVSGEALGRGVRLEYWKAKHENVVVLDLESELIQLGMTRIRDRENGGARFVHDANSVLRATLDLALTELPNDEEAVVTTPRGHKVEGVVFEDDVKVCGITVSSIADVEANLLQVLKNTLPFDSQLGNVIIQESDKGDARIVKASLPDDLDGCEVLLLVPEFNSLEKLNKLILLLRQEGVEESKISIVTLVTCPEAADKFCQTFGDAKLITASFDAARDRNGHIIPGVGDFEARYLGSNDDSSDAETTSSSSEDESPADLDSEPAKKSWWPSFLGGSK